jgi:hypothetical protein
MYVRGDIALVGWLYMVGVFVFCVVTVVATLSNFLNAFLRKLTTYAGWGTKGNHRIFREARQWRVYRHDHLKRIQYFPFQNRPTFQYDRTTDISKPTNKMSNYRDRVPCFCRFTGWRSRLSRSNLVAVAVATLHLAKEIIFTSSASSILAPEA